MRINKPIIGENNRFSNKRSKSNCMHDNCPQCQGAGVKSNGQSCVHMISCRCERCNPCSYKSQVRYTDFPPEKW